MMRRFASPKCKMLAEKIETPHEFQQARDMGFTYFQGYFFCRPELVIGREVPTSRVHYVRLLEMVSRREIDMLELEKLLKQEASISYRLLRYLNSPVFGMALEVKSIRHAMAILGEREMRRVIYSSQIIRPSEVDEIQYVVHGRSFLRYMVRKIVGTLLEVGRGRLTPADIPQIFESRDRSRSGPTVPPEGLYLVALDYPDPTDSLASSVPRRRALQS